MSQIWKKMKKSEMDAREKNFFRRKSFSFYAKKHLSKVEKNRDKININTRGKTLLLSCFFHVSPPHGIREKPSIWEEIQEKIDAS